MSTAALQHRFPVETGAIHLLIGGVPNHYGVVAIHQFRLRLHQPLGDLIGDFLRVQLIDAIMVAAVGDETVVFEVEAIERHRKDNGRSVGPFRGGVRLADAGCKPCVLARAGRCDILPCMMAAPRTELIKCHDCGQAVAFSAVCCPHCGSREPQGPYRMNSSEHRRFRIEARNDRYGAVVAGIAGAIGALYGLSISSSPLSAILWALAYGAIGLLAGVPIAVAVNLTRRLIR